MIVYRETERGLRVMAVDHARQGPGYWPTDRLGTTDPRSIQQLPHRLQPAVFPLRVVVAHVGEEAVGVLAILFGA